MRSRLTAVLASSLLCVMLAAPAHATFSGTNGKIVFTRVEPNANYDLYTINLDGTGLTRLTNSDAFPPDEASNANPAWSPDGKRIVFTRGRPDGRGIFVMNADGSGLTRLRDEPSAAIWSPNGSKLAFLACVFVDCYVSTMNPDGTGQESFVQGFGPAWSPDSSKLAFMGGGEINVMNADGTALTRITTGSYPVWSHGERIAFIRQSNVGVLRVLIVNSDGTGEILVPATGGHEFPWDWSPDGTKLLFESTRCRSPMLSSCLYTVNVDGSGVKEVAGGTGPAVWSPDGSRIAYLGDGGTNAGVFTANPDGTGVTRLTSGDEFQLDWQPIPGPRRRDYRNAAQFCKAKQASLGHAAFRQKYGTNRNRANAHGKCVSGK